MRTSRPTAVWLAVASAIIVLTGAAALAPIDGATGPGVFRFVGRFQPLALHLPIAFLLLAPLLEASRRLAVFLEMLANTDDPLADGSLLDNTIVLYGSGTSETHVTKNYPIIVASGRNMGLVNGIHRRYEGDLPFANLLLTLLQTLGVPAESFSDSTGTLDLKKTA